MAETAESTQGLRELGDGCFAYLQRNGGWGWSNAGLIVGDGQSLLVDTLFDLDLTATMLDAMSAATATAPVDTVVNTHANGDHCYGNAEVTRRRPDVDIVATTATANEMSEVPPSLLAALNQAPGEVGELAHEVDRPRRVVQEPRREHDVSALPVQQRQVGGQRPRVAVEVLARPELQRVDEQGHQHAVGGPSRFADQLGVALVQRAHRHDDRHPARQGVAGHRQVDALLDVDHRGTDPRTSSSAQARSGFRRPEANARSAVSRAIAT